MDRFDNELLQMHFYDLNGFKDSVSFEYGYGQKEGDFKSFSVEVEFTYFPESKKWEHKLGYTKEIEKVEEISGLTRQEFPKLMMKEYSEKFKSREIFYENAYTMLTKGSLRGILSEADNFNNGGIVIQAVNSHAESKLHLKIFLKDGETVGRYNIFEQKNGQVVNNIDFSGKTLYPTIEEFVRFLREESDYRLKIAML